jgi:hypothetical protein
MCDQITILAGVDNVASNADAVETFGLPLVPLDEQIRRAALSLRLAASPRGVDLPVSSWLSFSVQTAWAPAAPVAPRKGKNTSQATHGDHVRAAPPRHSTTDHEEGETCASS